MEEFTPKQPEEAAPAPEELETPAETVAEEPAEAAKAPETPVQEETPVEGPSAQDAPEESPEAPAEEPHQEPAYCPKADLEALNQTTAQMQQKLEALEELFRSRLLRVEHEERSIERMHAELQKYKSDLYAQLVRPILMDVIDIRDSILRAGATYQAKPEGEQSIPNKTFCDYTYDLLDILEKNGVEVYQSKPGDTFEPGRQRAVKKIITHDPELHGKVAQSLSGGYSYNGRVLSAEKIHVYFYEKPAEEPAAPEQPQE